MSDKSLIEILQHQKDIDAMDDLSAAIVYVGKVLEQIRDSARLSIEITERRADLELRMTNIHVQALEIAKGR
jgi:hypothetical protein